MTRAAGFEANDRGLIDWLLARKPWEIQTKEDGPNTMVWATSKSQLSGRWLSLGFVWTRQAKLQENAAAEYEKVMSGLEQSMAQALAFEKKDEALEEYFADTPVTP